MSVDMLGTTMHIWIPADTDVPVSVLDAFFDDVAEAAISAAAHRGFDAHVSSVHVAAPVSSVGEPGEQQP